MARLCSIVFANDPQTSCTRLSYDSGEAFRFSLQGGNTEAQTVLGVMYVRGDGVLQDYPEAVKWFREAAQQDNAEAQYKLGGMFENGDTEIGKRLGYEKGNYIL